MKEALPIIEELGNRPKLATIYNNMSQIALAQGRFDEAERCLREAIAINKELCDRPNLAIDYSVMSLLEKTRGNSDAAEAWMQKSWYQVADLPKSELRFKLAMAYVKLLNSKKKHREAGAILKQLS